MGCFNMMGFISNLPITYEDEIVVLICKEQIDEDLESNSPNYPSDEMAPLFLPIFGTYNDYGSVENYDDSDGSVVKGITDILGYPMDTILSAINRFGGMFNKNEEFNSDEKNIYFDIIKKLNRINYKFGSASSKYPLRVIMERRDVWDYLVSLSKTEVLVNAVKDITQYNQQYDFPWFNNVYTLPVILLNQDNLDRFFKCQSKQLELRNKYMDKFYIPDCSRLLTGYSKTVIHNTDALIDFLSFHESMEKLSFAYKCCSTASQSIMDLAPQFKKLNQFYLEILDKKMQEK